MGCMCSKDKDKPKDAKPVDIPEKAKSERQPTPKTPAEKPEIVDRRVEESSVVVEHDDKKERVERVNAIRSTKFRFGAPAVEGEPIACFPEGLLFRIENQDSWHFYNDTIDYEMHVNYRFGPESQIQSTAGTITKDSDGWFTVSAVVYPLQTIEYFTGQYNGYSSSITAKPLSNTFREDVNKDANQKALRAKQEVIGLFGESTDEAEVLRQCIDVGLAYVDTNFPPSRDTLYRPGVDGRVVPDTAWMRPRDYLPEEQKDDVKVFRGAVVPQAIVEGTLGDVWFTSSIAALAEKEKKIAAIFMEAVSDESNGASGVGAFHVKLNKHGWWHSVLVDDFLPTISKVPCYARSADDPCELWVSLLQKAYAKLHGSYAAITGGDSASALSDLTGCPSYRFDEEWESAALNGDASAKSNPFVEKLASYVSAGYIVVVNTPGSDWTSYLGQKRKEGKKAFDAKFKNAGLDVRGTYAVVNAKSFADHGVHLIQIRNPRGTGVEWKGAWGSGSAEWEKYPEIKKACGVSSEFLADGTFWMQWSDAAQYFDGGVVCFSPDSEAAPIEDFRVKGTFDGDIPSVVLEVTATSQTKVMITFSQADKRGLAETDPNSDYSALMLSVARKDDESNNKYAVHMNSSKDPQAPTTDFRFAIARDIAMEYTFEASETPYYVVPRIHSKVAFPKAYVLSMQMAKGSKENVSVAFKKVDESCKIFSNLATVTMDGVEDATAPMQFTDATHRTTTTETASGF